MKKVNGWAVLVKVEKKHSAFTEIMVKQLFGSIMEKHLKEMETVAKKNFEHIR